MEVTWKSPTLNKGQFMLLDMDDCLLRVDHTDRTVDPYLAWVFHGNRIIYTGLHDTLGDARRTAERKAREISNDQ